MATETAPLEVKPAAAAPGGDANPNSDAAIDAMIPDLMKNLLTDVDEPEQKKKADEKPAEPTPEQKAEAERLRLEEEAKKGGKPVEKPIVARREKLKRPDLPIQPVEPAKPKEPVVAVKTAAEPDADLEPEERQMIADAQEAESLLGTRHSGLAEKTRKFVRANIDFINKHTDAEGNFDDQSPEYLSFLASNRPSLTQADVREINEVRITNKAREQITPELEKIKHQRFVDREEPIIERVASETYNRVVTSVTPKEIMDAIAEEAPNHGGDRMKAFQAIKAYFKPELSVIDEVMNQVKEDVREMERISRTDPETGRPLVAVAQSPSDPKYAHHSRLAELVRLECEEFKKNAPASEQIRDGKWFVTKDEYARLRPDARGQFWTFSNKEAMERGLKRVPAYVQFRIKQKLDGMTADGFTRNPRQKKAAPVEARKGAPAAPHPTPAPAGGQGGQAQTDGAKLAAILNAG
jgi:hypothetical protein